MGFVGKLTAAAPLSTSRRTRDFFCLVGFVSPSLTSVYLEQKRCEESSKKYIKLSVSSSQPTAQIFRIIKSKNKLQGSASLRGRAALTASVGLRTCWSLIHRLLLDLTGTSCTGRIILLRGPTNPILTDRNDQKKSQRRRVGELRRLNSSQSSKYFISFMLSTPWFVLIIKILKVSELLREGFNSFF